jgi:hypothetical protein
VQRLRTDLEAAQIDVVRHVDVEHRDRPGGQRLCEELAAAAIDAQETLPAGQPEIDLGVEAEQEREVAVVVNGFETACT